MSARLVRLLVRLLVRWTITVPLVVLIVVLAFRLAPGDVRALHSEGAEGRSATESLSSQRFAEEHLLEAPFWRQYAHALGPFDLSPRGHRWFGGDGSRPWHGLLALEFGTEWTRPQVPIRDELARRALTTVPLALGAFAVALLLALPLSVWLTLLRTRARGRYLARLVSALLLVLDALPGFALALLLVALLGPQGANWFPATGLDSREPHLPFVLDRAWHLVLPVLALSLGGIAHLARQLSTALQQLEREEWMRAARANGLTRAQALRRHALPHALPPLIGLFGGALPALVSGAVVVETVFALQGLGNYATEAVLARDLSVVLATCTIAAVLAVVGSVLADELVRSLDPRSRQGDLTHG